MNRIGLKLQLGRAACMLVALVLLFALRGNAEATTTGISWSFNPQDDVGPTDVINVFATITNDYCEVNCDTNGGIFVNFYEATFMDPVVLDNEQPFGTNSPYIIDL